MCVCGCVAGKLCVCECVCLQRDDAHIWNVATVLPYLERYDAHFSDRYLERIDAPICQDTMSILGAAIFGDAMPIFGNIRCPYLSRYNAILGLVRLHCHIWIDMMPYLERWFSNATARPQSPPARPPARKARTPARTRANAAVAAATCTHTHTVNSWVGVGGKQAAAGGWWWR